MIFLCLTLRIRFFLGKRKILLRPKIWNEKVKKLFILWPSARVQGKYPVCTCRKRNPVCLFFVVVVCVCVFLWLLIVFSNVQDENLLTNSAATSEELWFVSFNRRIYDSHSSGIHLLEIPQGICEEEEGGKGSPNVADTTLWLFRKLFSGACSSLSNSMPNMKNVYLRRNREIVVNYGIKQRGIFTPSQYFIY